MSKSEDKLLDINEVIASELNEVKDYVIKSLQECNFEQINFMQTHQPLSTRYRNTNFKLMQIENQIEFISLNENSEDIFNIEMTEEEFFKIVGVENGELNSQTGRYQEKLYGNYILAKEKNDVGFISDIFDKAKVFKNNKEFIKKLMQDERFMKEWHKDYGEISPLTIFEYNGKMRKIEMVQERIHR